MSAFRLNLEQQKKLAKDLLKAARAGDNAALARINTPSPKLADAQHAIARELRFASWAKLKEHIASLDAARVAIDHKQPAPDGELRTLHIRCGSDIQRTLVDAGFTGDFLEHSDPFCQGPVTNAPDHYEQRARFVVEAYGKYKDDLSYERALAVRHEKEQQILRAHQEYERVVLWMEHDSYDQLILAHILTLYSRTTLPRVLELVNINYFPGSERFRGLGQLPAEALRMLWAQRRTVTSEQLATGVAAWNALASPDPRALVALMRTGTPAVPDMAGAIRRHLQELPSIANGLALTEQLLLQAIIERKLVGPVIGLLIFEREALPYLGDIMYLHILDCMQQVREPVFTREPAPPGEGVFKDGVAITDVGRAVLRGEVDWLSLAPPPRWVGGVEIRPGEVNWRWDDTAGDVRRK